MRSMIGLQPPISFPLDLIEPRGDHGVGAAPGARRLTTAEFVDVCSNSTDAEEFPPSRLARRINPNFNLDMRRAADGGVEGIVCTIRPIA